MGDKDGLRFPRGRYRRSYSIPPYHHPAGYGEIAYRFRLLACLGMGTEREILAPLFDLVVLAAERDSRQSQNAKAGRERKISNAMGRQGPSLEQMGRGEVRKPRDGQS